MLPSWHSSSPSHESSPVPAAHLAARRARRSPDSRLHHAGQRHAEDGYLRAWRVFPASRSSPTPRTNRRPWVIALAVIGIIYGALVALVQPNMKKLVAYSSVSHLGFVVLGVFSFTQQGLDGAVYQMLNHGISSTGALFLLVGYLDLNAAIPWKFQPRRCGYPLPNLAIVFLIATLASVGLPMLNNFVGEYPGAARRVVRQLHRYRVRRCRCDSLRLLHAVAVSTNVLRKTIRITKPSHAGPEACASGPRSSDCCS